VLCLKIARNRVFLVGEVLKGKYQAKKMQKRNIYLAS